LGNNNKFRLTSTACHCCLKITTLTAALPASPSVTTCHLCHLCLKITTVSSVTIRSIRHHLSPLSPLSMSKDPQCHMHCLHISCLLPSPQSLQIHHIHSSSRTVGLFNVGYHLKVYFKFAYLGILDQGQLARSRSLDINLPTKAQLTCALCMSNISVFLSACFTVCHTVCLTDINLFTYKFIYIYINIHLNSL